MKTYHVGIGRRKNTMVIQATENVDCLDCEIYDYMGRRETTKARLHEHRYDILKAMQSHRPGVYDGLRYAVVE